MIAKLHSYNAGIFLHTHHIQTQVKTKAGLHLLMSNLRLSHVTKKSTVPAESVDLK